MNQAYDLFEKLINLSIPELLRLCALALEDKEIDKKRTVILLDILEMRLQKEIIINRRESEL